MFNTLNLKASSSCSLSALTDGASLVNGGHKPVGNDLLNLPIPET